MKSRAETFTRAFSIVLCHYAVDVFMVVQVVEFVQLDLFVVTAEPKVWTRILNVGKDRPFI